MSELPTLRIAEDRSAVALCWPDGAVHHYHGVWLRDHGLDDDNRDALSGQKKRTALDIDPDLSVLQADISDAQLTLDFSDGSHSWLPLDWLRAHSYDKPATGNILPQSASSWDSGFNAADHSLSFLQLQQDRQALQQWLQWIEQTGFAHLHDVPRESGALFDVVSLFGFIRETNYGRSFEVRSEARPVNLAFTSLGLDPHTDNPYRDPVPTLQLLHCLENSAEGGDSVVVDGFHVARTLQQESARHFRLLSHYAAEFRFEGDGRSVLSATRPMLELSPGGTLQQVRINNRAFQGPRGVPYNEVPDYYQAYRHLVEITLRPQMTVRFRLNPGELFIVDNTRVLHGRTAFTATGQRWLQGSYADKDGLLSTLRLIERETA